jgi:hypothetical protein
LGWQPCCAAITGTEVHCKPADSGLPAELGQLLDGLLQRDRLHSQDAFMLRGTQATLSTANGEAAAA